MSLQSGKHINSESPIAKKRKGKVHDHGEIAIFRSLDRLPQDCLAEVISRTTPRDACVSYAVSRTFQSVAKLEAIWQCFLPSDYASFLSHAVMPVENVSKEELFFRLCNHPVSIYGGKMAFGLEKSSGAKCFTISARGMLISFIDCDNYWKWVPLSNSRFMEAAQLIYDKPWQSQLNFSGRIASTMLTSETMYAAYLIYRWKGFQITGASLLKSTVEMGTVTPNGTVCLDPERNVPRKEKRSLQKSEGDIKWSKKRRDGWREAKLGEFYIKSGENEMVKIILQKTEGTPIACILILGMEIRPKE